MKQRFKDLQAKQLGERLRAVEPFRSVHPPRSGWLKAIRTALDIPQSYVAKRLNVSVTAVSKYERGEVEGTVQIGTLRKAAAAMDCDFVYAIIPRGSIESIRFRRAMEFARQTVNSVAQTMALEGQALPKSELEARAVELAKTILAEHPRAIWEI